MFEFDSPSNNDEDVENTQIIVKILTFLSPEELRKARLVNFGFSKIITAHPALFWAKNMLRVRIRSSDNENQLQKEWAQLRLHKLITGYNCPNYHFVKTDLLAPCAVAFFQSSIRHQIKHLVLTKCEVTGEILIHILACIGRQLKHLEFQDFSKFSTAAASEETILESRTIPYLYFPSLSTLILSGESCKSSSSTGLLSSKSLMVNLTRNFLYVLLNGSSHLQKIRFLGWSARTCQRFTKLLGSVDPEKLEHVQSFEISCKFDKNLEAKQQFGLIKPLGSVYMPQLRKLSVSFEDACTYMEGFSLEYQHLVETLTTSIATLIEGCTDTLKSIELLNCPVDNNVFRAGINSFPNLHHVITDGSFVTKLNEDANPLYQLYQLEMINRSPQQQQHRSDSLHRLHEINEEMEMVRTISGNLRRPDTENLTRIEVYKIICAVVFIVAVVHASTKWAFGPYIGGHWEVFIYAIIVLVMLKSYELSKMWTSLSE